MKKKTALLLIGEYRTFDVMWKYINENLILPNDAIIFIYGEHTNEHDFDEKFDKKNVGKIKIIPSTIEVEECKQIYEKVMSEMEYPMEINKKIYLIRPAVIEYFQASKCHEMMEEYENKHNFKFDIVIKSRLDICVTMPLYISNYFSKVNTDLLDKYGQKVYQLSMGNEKLCNYYCKFAKLKKPENEKITESDMLETIQSINKKVWTFYTNLIWILKREVSNKVFDLINYIESTFYKTTKYISHDGRTIIKKYTAEWVFSFYVNHFLKLNQIAIFTPSDNKYITDSYIFVYPDNYKGDKINDYKNEAFDEEDLFLLRFREAKPPWINRYLK